MKTTEMSYETAQHLTEQAIIDTLVNSMEEFDRETFATYVGSTMCPRYTEEVGAKIWDEYWDIDAETRLHADEDFWRPFTRSRMNSVPVSRELFLAIEKAKAPELTPAQQRIQQRIHAGDKIRRVNTHHRSGGQWEWESDGGAGKIYRAFNNYTRAVIGLNGRVQRDEFFTN